MCQLTKFGQNSEWKNKNGMWELTNERRKNLCEVIWRLFVAVGPPAGKFALLCPAMRLKRIENKTALSVGCENRHRTSGQLLLIVEEVLEFCKKVPESTFSIQNEVEICNNYTRFSWPVDGTRDIFKSVLADPFTRPSTLFHVEIRHLVPHRLGSSPQVFWECFCPAARHTINGRGAGEANIDSKVHRPRGDVGNLTCSHYVLKEHKRNKWTLWCWL